MKKVLNSIFALCFLSCAAGHASTVIPQDEKSQNILLYTVIAKRCEHFLKTNEISKCEGTVSQLVDVLDAHIIFTGSKSFVFAAFKKELIKSLSSETTATFLNHFNKSMNDYLLGNLDQFNLWDLALEHFQTEEMSARILSALFQDTSLSRLHLVYLEKAQIKGNAAFTKNKQLLNRTIETMNLVFDYSKSSYTKLFYPTQSKGPLNRNIYHFYVPLNLSFKLQELGVSNQMSFTAPLLMTLTYEFITSESDYRYLLEDPETLDPLKHEWKIKDIFAGYQGAAMGSSKKTIKSLRFLKDHFSLSTNKTVKAMLQQ
jgi:hypothetical protein